MGYLKGLKEYLAEVYELSVFDDLSRSGENVCLHLHQHQIVKGTVKENQKFDVLFTMEDGSDQTIAKVEIKLLYAQAHEAAIAALLNTDQSVRAQNLQAILKPGERYFLKNKSLYPLMKERIVLVLTLLEGDVLRGLIDRFSRYEIRLLLKGGLPVTVLRHAIYRCKDKKGRNYLKDFQDKHKDWHKSSYYCADDQP